MELTFEHTLPIGPGSSPATVNIADGVWLPFVIKNNYLATYLCRIYRGLWEALTTPEQTYLNRVADDTPVFDIDTCFLSGNTFWLTWRWEENGKSRHRIVILPGPDVAVSVSHTDGETFTELSAIDVKKDGEIVRVEKTIPLFRGDDSGGYVFCLKLEALGKVILYELGYDISVRGR